MKTYTQKDLDHVMASLDLLSESEKEVLYKAFAHGTAYPDLESKRAFALDSVRAAVLAHTPKDAESPMHAAFTYLYDRTRRRLGFFESEGIIRAYYSICERRPEDRWELAIAARMVGEMQLYRNNPTAEAIQEAEQKLALSLLLYEGMDSQDPDVRGGRAKTLSSLAALFIMQGNYAEAEKLLKEAKAMFRALAYEGNEEWRPYYAGSMMNLGDLYIRIGKKQEAIHCYRRAVDILEKCKSYDSYYMHFALDHALGVLKELDEKEESET